MSKDYIVENSAICMECGDKIISKYRHDYVSCTCGNISVDGGQDYRKRNWKTNNWIDTSIIMQEDEVLEAVKAVVWGIDTGRNPLGIALAVIRSLRDTNNLIYQKTES